MGTGRKERGSHSFCFASVEYAVGLSRLPAYGTTAGRAGSRAFAFEEERKKNDGGEAGSASIVIDREAVCRL